MKSIVITGNMGSGKTAVCQALAKLPKVRLVAESVDDNPFLKLAYENRAEHNLLLQLHFLFHRFEAAQLVSEPDDDPTRNLLIVFDRYFYDSSEVYIPVHRELGNLTEAATSVLLKGCDSLERQVQPPDLLVYLASDPARARDRILARNRDFEAKVEMEFLRALHAKYEGFFERYSNGAKLRIESERYRFAANVSELDEVVNKIILAVPGAMDQ